jgi:small-conductance mechanosensitive channel
MYVPLLISAAIVMAIGLFIADALRKMTLTTCQSLGIPSAKTIASFVFYFIVISVLMSALTQAKINTDFIKQNLSIVLGGLVAAFAIGYGLASRNMMANFLASLYSKDRFKIGDTISINGTTGTIENMDSTTLTLTTPDKKRVIVPLSKLTTETVEIHE